MKVNALQFLSAAKSYPTYREMLFMSCNDKAIKYYKDKLKYIVDKDIAKTEKEAIQHFCKHDNYYLLGLVISGFIYSYTVTKLLIPLFRTATQLGKKAAYVSGTSVVTMLNLNMNPIEATFDILKYVVDSCMPDVGLCDKGTVMLSKTAVFSTPKDSHSFPISKLVEASDSEVERAKKSENINIIYTVYDESKNECKVDEKYIKTNYEKLNYFGKRDIIAVKNDGESFTYYKNYVPFHVMKKYYEKNPGMMAWLLRLSPISKIIGRVQSSAEWVDNISVKGYKPCEVLESAYRIIQEILIFLITRIDEEFSGKEGITMDDMVDFVKRLYYKKLSPLGIAHFIRTQAINVKRKKKELQSIVKQYF